MKTKIIAFSCLLLMVAVLSTSSRSAPRPAKTKIDSRHAKKNAVLPPDWVALMQQPNANYYQIRAKVLDFFKTHPSNEDEFKDKTEGSRLSRTNFLRWDTFWSTRTDTSDERLSGSFSNLLKAYTTVSQTAICPPTNPCASAWRLLGPVTMPKQNMGIVVALAINPVNPNIIYAGTNNSGLWKTENGGTSWTCKTDSLRYPGMGVYDVQIDPANPNILFIGTGNRVASYGSGVFKSLNGGNTWVSTGLAYNPTDFTVVRAIRVDPSNSNNVYAITNLNLYASTDGGMTWSSIPIPFTSTCYAPLSLDGLELLPADPNTLFVTSRDPQACNNGAQVWKVHMAGTTPTVTSVMPLYQVVNPPPPPPHTPTPYPYETVTPAWFPPPPNYPYDAISIAVTPATPDKVYVIYDEDCTNNIDAQTQYSFQTTYDNTTGFFSPAVASAFGPSVFAVSPTDSSLMYLGTQYLYKSTDGGVTWSFNSAYSYWPPPTHGDVRAIRVVVGSPQNTGGSSDKVYIGSDGGVSKTVNGGGTWTNINGTGLAITQFFGIGNSDSVPEIFSGGTQDNGAFTDTFGAWSQIYGSLTQIYFGDAYGCEIDALNPQYMYLATNGGLNESTDSGLTWGPIPQPGSTSPLACPLDMSAVDNSLYVGWKEVYQCTNPSGGSINWVPRSNFAAIPNFPSGSVLRALAVAPSDPNVIYAAFDRVTYNAPPVNIFFRTTDHGATWTDIGNPQPPPQPPNASINLSWLKITDIAVDQYNSSQLWITMDGFGTPPGSQRVFYSNDGGNTFSDYSTGLPDLPVNTIAFENGSNQGLYVGTDAGVFYRNAAMAQWQCYSNNLPACYIFDLRVNYGKNVIRAGTFGRGVWESNLWCPQNYDLTLTGATSSDAFNEVQDKIFSTQQITGGAISYRGGRAVELNPGFSATTTHYFSAFIHPCDLAGNSSLSTH